MLFTKNYALLVLLSIIFLNFGFRVDGLRLVSKELHSNSEDEKTSYVRKTMKTKYGDIIDCIDRNKQPAFNHPSLKNHKIQEQPNFPNGWTKGSSSIAQVTDLKHLGFHQECPVGTVPIRRNTNKESSSLMEPLGETLSDKNSTDRVKMSAIVRAARKDTRYIAASAQIDIRNPKCKLGESSSAFVWLLDGHLQNFNMILAGWTVNPALYGDGKTRLSTFWADRVYDTGCYDFLCPGFVQVDRVVPLGTVLPNISVSGGPKYHITINIFQDPETKNWWLHFGETHTPIGYWPNAIFSHFSNAAARIDLGGFVEGISGQPNPSMGSGILPDGTSNYDYVSYYSHIEYITQDNVTTTPQEQDMIVYHDDAYGVEFHSSTQGKGANFLYGGPNSRNILNRQVDAIKDM